MPSGEVGNGKEQAHRFPRAPGRVRHNWRDARRPDHSHHVRAGREGAGRQRASCCRVYRLPGGGQTFLARGVQGTRHSR
ncbi:TPA: (2Fe-2S)-binding protein [Stenotrophomonas maltophilia]